MILFIDGNIKIGDLDEFLVLWWLMLIEQPSVDGPKNRAES
jgi:hypothetical protein